jgi:hypothetical protein
MTTEHPPAGVSALAPRDQEAIARTLTSLLAGFSERNVDKLADVYSDDADWVNAFGSVKHGRQERSSPTCAACSPTPTSTPARSKRPPRAASASSRMRSSWCRPTSSSKDRDCSTAVSSTSETTIPFTFSNAKATAHGP